MSAEALIIVESPTKVKTIKRFLGSHYMVEASGGHVRDLPKSRMGVRIEEDFEPDYINIRGKGDVIKTLKEKAKKAGKIYLATDPDREGEAIAWHLEHLLRPINANCCRISFNEITKEAVKKGLAAPRRLDTALVDAQQARRVLDRVTGYSVSPLLWKKVKKGLSAGRVQSAALNLICSRDEEIEAFVPTEYWSLGLTLQAEGLKKPLELQYAGKTLLGSEAAVQELLSSLEGKDFTVSELETVRRYVKAPLPFTTSTLQQEAARSLNFSPQKTMRVAQQLYEGVELKGEGVVGLITYLRTDSTRISEEADSAARSLIRSRYGEGYVTARLPEVKNAARAQDAHEAIRPSAVTRLPQDIRGELKQDEYRLYNLIWSRFVASRMADYAYDSTHLTVAAGEARFKAQTQQKAFEGFRLVYNPGKEKSDKASDLAALGKAAKLTDPLFTPEQHFTQPPAHYTEAALVHTMEERGIGRPSTYAPTLATLMERHYVSKEGRSLFATDLGIAVNRLVREAVPMLADSSFTASMEEELDRVAEGELEWKQVLRDFYPDFKEKVDAAEAELAHVELKDEVSDVPCEKCGRLMVYKYGPHGRFLACPGFPECRSTKPVLEKAGCSCPKCGGDIIIRRTKKGRRFYACEKSPECDYISWTKPKNDETGSTKASEKQ